jgi:hypothetical protein
MHDILLVRMISVVVLLFKHSSGNSWFSAMMTTLVCRVAIYVAHSGSIWFYHVEQSFRESPICCIDRLFTDPDVIVALLLLSV